MTVGLERRRLCGSAFARERFAGAPKQGVTYATFRITVSGVEIHRSARKHGVAGEDIFHAIDHALATENIGEEPDRWLLLGPDRAANMLEVVVLVTAEGDQLAIHAMRMRPTYERLLRP